MSFFRLPQIDDPARVDVAVVGVPWDGGTTNRPGARHGPREVRAQSMMIRPYHHVTRRSPYDVCRVADLGDSPVNPVDLEDSLRRIESFQAALHAAGAAPLSVGGDHLVTLPVLRAIARDAPVGLVQFDAHSDINDVYFGGSRFTHGTVFRRAIEEGLVDPQRTIQIGIRGSRYSPKGGDFAAETGIRVLTIEDVFEIGVAGIVAEVHRVVGSAPAYLTFDVDALDPVYAPGTGTPEVGGMTTHMAQAVVRGLGGLDLVGADVVEVAPPFDVNGATALVGATLAFEILCVLAEARARTRPSG
ncbi:agmatinase [Rhodospira trueperi]|uniref:agmatinase n=1 Tax=Rhodospira trueperi TaxID=69960 RepID=UPI000A445F92|nr:agmatinase [Rhodospira trueperi]